MMTIATYEHPAYVGYSRGRAKSLKEIDPNPALEFQYVPISMEPYFRSRFVDDCPIWLRPRATRIRISKPEVSRTLLAHLQKERYWALKSG